MTRAWNFKHTLTGFSTSHSTLPTLNGRAEGGGEGGDRGWEKRDEGERTGGERREARVVERKGLRGRSGKGKKRGVEEMGAGSEWMEGRDQGDTKRKNKNRRMETKRAKA